MAKSLTYVLQVTFNQQKIITLRFGALPLLQNEYHNPWRSMADEEENQAQQPAPVQIMPSVTITPMPEFNPDAKLGTSIATRRNNWQTDFEMYLTASGITDPRRK